MNLFELFVKIGVDDQASGKISAISDKLGNGLRTAANIGAAAVASAFAGISAITAQSISGFAEYEQLAGGASKIFDEMDPSKILNDAQNAYRNLGLSANQYLSIMNNVGATFAATMGDEAGYRTAQVGLQAITDYATGTGRSVDELSEKFTLITRSTASYQSIADQFSGILPATSAGFLEQAQAAGILSDSYEQLTEVPIEEYQEAVSEMLRRGVDELGLAGNAYDEAFTTISGSLSMAKAAWSNLVTGFADENANLDALLGNFVESVGAVAENVIPRIGTIAQSLGSLVVTHGPEILTAGRSFISGFASGIIEGIPDMVARLPEVIQGFLDFVTENLPQIVENGKTTLNNFVDGILDRIPDMVARLPEIINAFVSFFVENGMTIISAGFDILINLVTGIINAIPELVARLPQIIQNFVKTIVENFPKIIDTGFDMLMNLLDGIFDALPELVEDIPEIAGNILDAFGEALSGIFSIGENIVRGLWDGIKSMGGWIGEKVNGFLDGIFSGAEAHEEIHSPSRKWARFGANMAAGVGVGWDEEFPNVSESINGSLDFGTKEIGFESSSIGGASAGVVNGIGSSVTGRESERSITVNLMMPDGTQFASYILGPLADYAKANGTPLLSPQ